MCLETLENIYVYTQNMTGSGMNETTGNPTEGPMEDHILRCQFPRDIFTLEQSRRRANVMQALVTDEIPLK